MPEPTVPQAPSSIPLVPTLCVTASVGALLVAISQFMPLYHAHASGVSRVIASGSVGSDHSWALLPVAVLAGALAFAILLVESRVAVLGVGLLGLVTVVVALSHDLSSARARGIRPVGANYVAAANAVAGGLYVEIAGGLLLLIAAVGGFLFLPPPRPSSRPRGAEQHA